MIKKFIVTVAVAATAAIGGLSAPAHATASEDQRATSARSAIAKPVSSRVSASLVAVTVRNYAGGYQFLSNTGAAANMNIYNPQRNASEDPHTLTEIAVQNTTTGDTVEVGWGKGTFCATTTAPCLWVSAFDNGVWKGYNTGFVDYAANPRNVGDTLPVTVNPGTNNARFSLEYFSGNWWASLNEGNGLGAQWLGYFPESATFGSFASSDLVQVFGETVSLDNATSTQNGYPCSDMGNGVLGLDVNTAAARLGTITLIGNPTTAVDMIPFANTKPATGYGNPSAAGAFTAEAVGGATTNRRTLRYGGPGYAGTSTTTAGTAGSC